MSKGCSDCKYALTDESEKPCRTCRYIGGSFTKYEPVSVTPASPEVSAGREKGNLLHYPDSRHGDVISLCLNGDKGFC